MNTHTPGAWFVFANGHCVGGPVDGAEAVSFAGDKMETAGVAMCAMARRSQDEIYANACLIATAPELLAALKRIVHWYDSEHLAPETMFNNPEGAFAQARAALAKVQS